jgi:hypothetical protein
MKIIEILKNIFNNKDSNRPDIAVRYLYIENFFNNNNNNNNNIGRDLYIKMQSKRTEGDVNKYCKEFDKLILSIKENGVYKDTTIPINEKKEILDGSHRMACFIYFNLLNFDIKIEKKEKKSNYNFDWFEKNFTKEELSIIKEKYKEIKKRINENN